jgi:hypothetical protein
VQIYEEKMNDCCKKQFCHVTFLKEIGGKKIKYIIEEDTAFTIKDMYVTS